METASSHFIGKLCTCVKFSPLKVKQIDFLIECFSLIRGGKADTLLPGFCQSVVVYLYIERK